MGSESGYYFGETIYEVGLVWHLYFMALLGGQDICVQLQACIFGAPVFLVGFHGSCAGRKDG